MSATEVPSKSFFNFLPCNNLNSLSTALAGSDCLISFSISPLSIAALICFLRSAD